MKQTMKRMLCLLMVAALLAGFMLPAAAETEATGGQVTFTQVDNSSVSASLLPEEAEIEEEAPAYADTDMVRVSIVLEEKSTVEMGWSVDDIARNTEALAYRAALQDKQDSVTASIERALGEELDVAWNLTLAANLISANVAYGQIETIEAVKGVSEVLIETQYAPDVVETEETADPNMSTSTEQTGSAAAWAAGYTGAGSRIAVIDTGTDTDHQSFSAEGFAYSLAYQAGLHDMTVDEYIDYLDLLDREEILAVADQLNVEIDAEQAYLNMKLPFGYNYIDADYDITHDNDSMSEHGSHVAGIAAANAYILQEDGGFARALTSVYVQGVAPDAQLITMKVFGKNGGAYASDYMAAIEDAIVLGCDSINLSLGSAAPGDTRCSTALYQSIMDNLTKAGAVVTMSAGNNGSWAEHTFNGGYLYSDDVNMHTSGAPGTYTNSLSVASVDNAGYALPYIAVGDALILYNEVRYYQNALTSVAGEQDYVFIDGYGTAEDWAAVGDALTGKIAICSRGDSSFSQKAAAATAAGAIATIIYNNVEGAIYMNLSDYYSTYPCVSITADDAAQIKAQSEAVTDEAGNVLYYTGKMTVSAGVTTGQYDSEYNTMSSFSAWGVPGTLEMKPEITAPGGSIYSVNGLDTSGTAYEVMSGTSMAAPQVTGMAALVAQYIREEDLEEKTGLSARQLAQSLLMSTAEPILEEASNFNYPIIRQDSGLANVSKAITADSYILMAEGMNAGAADGKVKVELGDDPDRNGKYTISFTINNLTEQEKAFELYADFFTQNYFEDNVKSNSGGNIHEDLAYYMDTTTVEMPVIATWTVDGMTLAPSGDVNGLDFDGNGSVNTNDGQTLLNYVVGLTDEISNLDLADLDADGDVDSYDVYLFFRTLGTSCAMVPAGGSVEVTVEIELTEEWDAYIETWETKGLYIEGFLYARSLSDAEGLAGTTHSIPVLGWYGNWTDPSMMDRTTYVQSYVYRDFSTIPYLGLHTMSLVVNYGNMLGAYHVVGNPVVIDETYMPERNALNGTNGTSLYAITLTPIRNVADSKIVIKNETTGEILEEIDTGALQSAYYNSNSGGWPMNYSGVNKMEYRLKSLTENDRISATITMAPEYYVDDEGNTDWDALGEGASWSASVTIDNTAPVVENIYVDLLNNELVVKASDNRYVAAVALLNKSGTKSYGIVGAKQDIEPGESAEYALSLDEVNGRRFMVQVIDYAMNITTYQIEVQIGEQQPVAEVLAFNVIDKNWISFDKTASAASRAVEATSDVVLNAATVVDHLILASASNGDLYAIYEDDLTDMVKIGNLGTVLTEMAYNPVDGYIYGLNTANKLVRFDRLNAELTVLGEIGVVTNTLACDANGTFYCNEPDTGSVYTFTLETMAEPTVLIENVGVTMRDKLQSMEYDPNTGRIFWASYGYTKMGFLTTNANYLFEIDPATATYTRHNKVMTTSGLRATQRNFSCLIITMQDGKDCTWASPTNKIEGLEFAEDAVTVYKSDLARLKLEALVLPWTVSDRSVTYTSADETIAVVDGRGYVQGLKEGVTTITATSVLDPSFTATCTVTVTTPDYTIEGMLQDAEGQPQFFDWNMKTEETWTAGDAVSSAISAASYNESEDVYYVAENTDSGFVVHKMDENGQILQTSATTKSALWDITTDFSGKFAAVSGQYLLMARDPMKLTGTNLDTEKNNVALTAMDTTVTMIKTTIATGETEIVELPAYLYIVLHDTGEITQYYYVVGPVATSHVAYTYSSDLDFNFTTGDGEYTFCSMVMGSDGALYLSAFNGERNELYRLIYNEESNMYESEYLGEAGEGVWPVSLIKVTANGETEGGIAEPLSVVAEAELMAAAEEPVLETCAIAEAPCFPASAAEVDKEENTVTLTVTAKDAENNEVDSTNGVMTVNYDASKLTLVSTAVNGDYTAKVEADGTVTFGYVAMNGIPAGEAVATLTFTTESGNSNVIVEQKQVNNETGATETLLVELEHANTEIRDAREATCTEDGYTGDTYCTDCGELIAKGEVIPATGHSYGEWTVTKAATCFAEGEEVRTCACGEVETRVIEKRTDCPSDAFSDLDKTQWYHEGVDFVLDNGLMKGMSDTVFVPNGEVTRAQLVTILYRLEGQPSVEGLENPFKDVTENAWYAEAVIWAVNNGVVNGTSETTFDPNAAITREQIAAILFRYAGAEAVEEDHLKDFTDANQISAYAVDAMNWAVSEGLITGMGDGTVAPRATATRAQIATILMRYCN